jgi:uncharacterized protein YycO
MSDHRFFLSGDEARTSDYRPGDFILTHGDAWTSKLIRFGSRLRYHGDKAPFAKFSHSAMIVSATGDLVEARKSGVERSHLSDYKYRTYVVIDSKSPAFPTGETVNAAFRVNSVKFAESCVGNKYGYITCVAIGLNLLTGGKFDFGIDGQEICSGLVSRCLERFGYIFPRDPAHQMPADLAVFFGVNPLPEWNA